MSELNDYLVRSAAAISAMAERDLTGEMERAVSAVVTALSQGKALLICGNGGSASDAIHIAGELVGRFLKERKAYNVIALPANAAVLTAWAMTTASTRCFRARSRRTDQPVRCCSPSRPAAIRRASLPPPSRRARWA